ncbi:GNAT family N-acetyltransferase [Paenibacillus sp. IHBB 10380]|uniref:GNAT family N-acetyltransferase n=1 Tax=Paenibacillus sp. IHBB 10380 TaxID=1566358 RepID=UPI0005CFD7F8|nr:GNAT family N-acetyltransferase [Paenibacillus sp. IHBB 10380]AJS57886.1 GNAT family acetyltransferase [Paenibacillus sp. IHBB 10380]
MSEYQLISDYKHIEKYKESFNELAKMIFEINFKDWYSKGCWNDNYICYSYVNGDQIIANASVNKMIVTSNGKEYKAIQLGTVMTHPDYRHQGLAVKLMNHIIEKYEKDYDFIYLFANDTVLDFYPRFGFEKVQESSFSLMVSDLKKQVTPKSALRKLDVNNQIDFEVLKEFATERIPVSSRLGIKGNEDLLMFYFILVFNDAIYYVEEEDVIVLFKEAENQLHVFDIVSKKTIDLEVVVKHIISDATEMIHFYFVPDSDNENIQSGLITETDDTLFVRPLLKDGVKHFLFPLTSHA